MRIAIGQVVGAHGIRGEVRVVPLTDFPERFAALKRVYLEPGGEGEVRVLAARPQKQQWLLQLEGVSDRSAAEKLRGVRLTVPEGELWPLPEGHVYVHQVVGLRAETEAGTAIGVVREVLRLPANDVYVVEQEPPGRLLYVPATREVVRAILPAEGRMVIHPLPGLLEEGDDDAAD